MAISVGTIVRALTKLGVTVGPVVVTVVQRLLQDPEKLSELQSRLTTLTQKSGTSAEEMLETIGVLRDQVQDLTDSADNERETACAKGWAKQLDGFEKAAKLLQAPGAQKKDLKKLRKKINALRTEILNAHITELGDDGPRAPSARPRLRRRRTASPRAE